MDQQHDILSDHVSVRWEECRSVPNGMMDVQAFWLNDRYYLTLKEGLKEKVYVRNAAELYIYTPALEYWEKRKVPVYNFAVTTYCSELVLVGGIGREESGVNSDKLLVWKDNEWKEDLHHPMPVKRCSASAVSEGDHLVVAGGYGDNGTALKRVDVYDGVSWRPAEPLPEPWYLMKSILYDGKWYMMGGEGQGKRVYCASLKDLIATSKAAVSTEPTISVWSQLPDAPFEHSCPAVFGNKLIITGPNNPALFAYSNKTWESVGEIPGGFGDNCTISLPSGELMVVGKDKGSSNYRSLVGFTESSKEDELTTVKREVSQLRHGKKAAIEEYDQLREEYKRLKTELAQEKSGLPPAQTPQKQDPGFYLRQMKTEDLVKLIKELGCDEETLKKMNNNRDNVIAWLREAEIPNESLNKALNKINNQD